MSHVTDLRVRMRDLAAMADAVAAAGLEFRTNKKTFAGYEGNGHCEHAIGVPGKAARTGPSGEYEIGVVPAPDGDGYDLKADTWGPGRVLQDKIAKLKQEYAAAVAMKKAKAKLAPQGFRVMREDLPSGRIRLRARRA